MTATDTDLREYVRALEANREQHIARANHEAERAAAARVRASSERREARRERARADQLARAILDLASINDPRARLTALHNLARTVQTTGRAPARTGPRAQHARTTERNTP